MLYKGGPKNYSKRDWQLAAWIFGGLFFLALIGAALSPNSSSTAGASSAIQTGSDDRTSAEPADYRTNTSDVSESSLAAGVPPTATVDGVTYTGEQQIEAMTQAARDAGMDEATAQRIGQEAATLCNGNPDCLR